jgi:hypothetical protein
MLDVERADDSQCTRDDGLRVILVKFLGHALVPAARSPAFDAMVAHGCVA